MTRGDSPAVRWGLPETDTINADLAALSSADAETRDVLLSAIARSGNPVLAVRTLATMLTALASSDRTELLAGVRDDPVFRSRLIGLLGASEPLGEHLAVDTQAWTCLRRPDWWNADDAPTNGLLEPTRELENPAELPGIAPTAWSIDAEPAVTALRRHYLARLAALAAADVAPAVDPAIEGPTVTVVGRALAALSDAVLNAALDLAAKRHPSPRPVRLAVIAMGKSGAGELNYLSDVDVVFVAHDDADQAELKLATARATTLMQICSRVAWEVDAALRPEGKAGPLVRTVSGFRTYYEKWAKTWEFQALLKARPAAGDVALGGEFVTLAQQLVWTAADRPGFVSDVQAMRRRVEASVPVNSRDSELKLSAGGLRDVEFAVQLLQLVHGRSDVALRAPATLDALAALTAGGYVGRSDGAALADAYAFERRIEHCAQLQHLRRTHSLPAAHADRQWLARTAGLFGADGVDAAGQLVAEIARHGATVRRLHEKLFYRPLLTAVAAVPTDELRLTSEAAQARLAALGFEAAQPALRHIQALTEGVSRRAAIQRALLPALLGKLADGPDPDAGLLGYRTVSDALAETPWYLRLLRDEGIVSDRLALLLGTSRMVADLLQRAPEVLRLLADDSALSGTDADRLAQAAEVLAARAERARTADAAASAARSARRHEMLRLACADLLGLADTGVVMAGLTSIADATVTSVLAAAHRQVYGQRLGRIAEAVDESPAPLGEEAALAASVSVIAMGRFGGAEMGYSSDADALFIAVPSSPDRNPAEVAADAAAIAEATTTLLGRPSPDPALVIDADLRPEGRSGPLVRTVDSYRQYWARRIEPWQRQALLRARPLRDDGGTAEFFRVIDPLRYPEGGLSTADTREILRIKARVDAERLPRSADRTLHTKLGSGGLADIEWAVQLLQLRHAGHDPGLRTTSTLGAINAAVHSDLVDRADADALIEGWMAATRARNAIMLVTGRANDQIPPHGRPLASIARACGYPEDADPGEFIDDYRRATRHARRAVEHLFDQS